MTFLSTIIFADYPRPWQVSFQKPATTMMEGIIDLHHDIFTFLVIILVFVTFMLGTIIVRYQASFSNKEDRIPVMQYQNAHGVTHNTTLEIVWTIVPTLILLLIATPSFALIYALDEIVEPELTVRVVGRQWYWTYEFPDQVSFEVPITDEMNTAFSKWFLSFIPSESTLKQKETSTIDLQSPNEDLEGYQNLLANWTEDDFTALENKLDTYLGYNFASEELSTTIDQALNTLTADEEVKGLLNLNGNVKINIPGFSFNSYIVATEDLFPGSFRLLEVDRRLVLPFGTNIRVLVTSYDVIHSWTVPSFGIKVDALPGRLNEYYLNLNYLGLFYGQCSEICGVNHGFMPIKVEVTTEDQFRWWFLQTSLLENSPAKFRNLFNLDQALETSFNSSIKGASFVDFFREFLVSKK